MGAAEIAYNPTFKKWKKEIISKGYAQLIAQRDYSVAVQLYNQKPGKKTMQYLETLNPQIASRLAASVQSAAGQRTAPAGNQGTLSETKAARPAPKPAPEQAKPVRTAAAPAASGKSIELSAQLPQIERCTGCGAELVPNSKFCSKCGSKAERAKTCPQCGNKLSASKVLRKMRLPNSVRKDVNIMNRILALLLCGMLIFGMFSGCSSSEDTVDTQPATEYVPRELPKIKYHAPADAFSGGSGTEADPYQISCAEELALLNKLIVEEDKDSSFDEAYTNAWYILTADIELNDTADFADWADTAPEYDWEPIGKAAELSHFCGVFDGNGYTIRGLYINDDAYLDDARQRNYGLFAKIEGTVKNLNIDKAYICVNGIEKNVGSICGAMVLDHAAIKNCTSTATIETSGGGNVGGIVGNGNGSIRSCQFSGIATQTDENWVHMGGICGSGGNITDCTNLGIISGSGYTGGIVGYGSVVTNSSNQGTISGDTSGGICGNLYRAGTGLEVTVAEIGLWNCANEGQINAISCGGGIVGKVGNDESDVDMIVSGCENRGRIHCDQVAAGIIGSLSAERANILSVENCVNQADIIGRDKVGGIICELSGAVLHQEGDVRIFDCINNGAISSTEGMYAGGIVTYFLLMGEQVDLRLTMENCTNSGSVTSQNNAGGILCFSSSMLGVGTISDDSAITLRGCENSGDITGRSSNSFVGGIAGNFGVVGIRTICESCTNSGNVSLVFSLSEEEIQETLESGYFMSLSQMVGGIVGRLGEGAMLTTDNDNGNAVNVNAENAWISFRNCNNTGTLKTTDYSKYRNSDDAQIWKNYIGGIIGNTCAEDAYSFSVENCTYIGAERGLGNTEYPDIG